MMRRAPIPHRYVRQSAGSAAVVDDGLRHCACARAWLRRPCRRSSLARCSPALRWLRIPSLQHRRAQQPSRLPKQARQHLRPAAQDRPRPAALPAGRPAASTTRASNRVIAQGNVEIYYNNYILTADQVVYDQSTNTLIGRGQRPAQGPQRQHHARRPLRGARRLPRRLRAVAERRHRRTTRASPPSGRAGAKATSPSTSAPSSRPARTTPACRRCGASAPRASSTTSRRPPSPTRTRSSSCSACRSCTCPTSSTPTRR